MNKWMATFVLMGAIACKEPPKRMTETSGGVTDSPGVSAVIQSGNPSGMTESANGMTVPILCYHQIRDYRSSDSKIARDYIVPPAIFKAQMKGLAESGYHAITPDELYAARTKHTPLPAKPVMITFDDTDLDQYTIGAPTLEQYKFKGVFFIMTVSIGRPNYMTKEQIKSLSDRGHVIGSHTWDHHNVKKYQGDDWETQIEKPTKTLETITGKKIDYFAYPFGLWNEEAIPELKKRGFKAAFQLYSKNSVADSLFTIRRIIITGDYGAEGMIKRMKKAFPQQ